LNDIEWALWHQGVIVWDNNGNGDGFADIGVIYNRILSKQNDGGKTRIALLGPKGVYQAIPRAIKECQQQHPQFISDMHYACVTRKMAFGIATAAHRGDMEAVRSLYHSTETQDENKQNVSACYNRTDLIHVLQSACGYTPN
jgi:hypothetical protein